MGSKRYIFSFNLQIGESLEIKEGNCLKAVTTCIYKNNQAFLVNHSIGYKCPEEPPPGHSCVSILRCTCSHLNFPNFVHSHKLFNFAII